jgi:glycosyltransferase involved in cell wall biosynthesis
MFISVITANYNGGTYLEEAIESVLNQDYDNYEFIIIDDGSSDGSKDIIESYYSNYKNIIKPIFRPKNCGQGACFNIGISSSKGDVVSFLDSDDYWFKSKLAKVYNRFSAANNFAIHQHNLQILKNNKITDKKYKNVLLTGDYFNDAKENRIWPWFVPTSGLSFPKNVLDKVLPIPDQFITCADGYLTRTGFCYGEILSDSECLGAYRVHDENNTFDNPVFRMDPYIYGLLTPALNYFYLKNDIDLSFPEKRILVKLLNVSPRKILETILPKDLFIRIEKFIER